MMTNKQPLKNELKSNKAKAANQTGPTPSQALATKPDRPPAVKPAHDSTALSVCQETSCCTNDHFASHKTRVVIKYDVGFNNHLTIRGKGANLNWDKGLPLKNIKRDEWVWETDIPFTQCEFKILLNDAAYETGENHRLKAGSSITYTPHF